MKSDTFTFYRYFPVSGRDKKWGFFSTSAGESRIGSHTVYPPGGHPTGFDFDWQHGRILEEFALIYISGGSGKFESRPNFSTSIAAGDAILLFPNVWHRYTPDPETGWHEHWIGFDGEMPRRWLRENFLSPKKPVIKINAEDAMLATFSRTMQSIRANRPALQQILAGAAHHLLGLIYSSQQTQPATSEQNANAIELAITRIQNECEHDLDMSLLARDLGVSYTIFRRTFTSHTGLSPHRYLMEFRLIRARNLLAETQLSVKQIALQVGFEDEHYFSRVFRQKLNLTASQWRNRSRVNKTPR